MKNMKDLKDIRIGTIVGADRALELIPRLLPYGFECFEITFGADMGDTELRELGKRANALLEGSDCVISCVGLYGNPLVDNEYGHRLIRQWERLIDNMDAFGTNVIGGFTGRIPDVPVDQSIGRYREVFGELAKRAADKGVKIAFENCNWGGSWERGDYNIAFCERAWELMFDALPDDNIGLQWEPCHHMVQLVDPMPMLRKWVGKMICLHGKDATIDWDLVRRRGIYSGEPFAWHRTPGFGDCNWTDIISVLRMNGFRGSIDIEGYHDPVYNEDLEWTGQVYALNYLKQCKGGEFVSLDR